MPRVILFSFLGREACVRAQLPILKELLRRNPDATFEGWNLARNPEDHSFLRSLSGDICIRDDFYGHPGGWDAVWRHYSAPHVAESDTIYIKFDDDLAFIEIDRFEELIKSVRAHPGSIISAQVINNGASLLTIPDLHAVLPSLGIPLLDVHTSNRFAELSHEWFFENWESMIDQPTRLIPSETWLSINLVGMDQQALNHIAKWVGQPSPPRIADREWAPGSVCGDEGAANMLPRYILHGLAAGHISFGPQALTDHQWDAFLTMYESIGRRYLDRR